MKKVDGYGDMSLYQYSFSCAGLESYLALNGSKIDIKDAFKFFDAVHEVGFMSVSNQFFFDLFQYLYKTLKSVFVPLLAKNQAVTRITDHQGTTPVVTAMEHLLHIMMGEL